MIAANEIPVCVLASGKSRRFGSPKGLVKLQGRPLIAHVIARIEAQTSAPIIVNAAAGGVYAELGYPLSPDRAGASLGPLAGLQAAMAWGGEGGFSHIATAPLDTPFLPSDLIERLAATGAPAIAASLGRWHPVTGLWPCDLAGQLLDYLETGKRSAHGWAEHCGANVAEFAAGGDARDPFWNINTPADLAEAEAALPASD